jgi:LPXTG-motif cell wall-anchored protein
MRRLLAAVVAAVLALAGPAVALGQTPGDEQYTDPFGGSQPANPGGGNDGSQGGGDDGSQGGGNDGSQGGGGGGGDAGSQDEAPAAPAAPSGGDAPVASDDSSGGTADSGATQSTQPAAEQLPYTGADAALLALVGTLLLAGGVALRLRLRDVR